MPTGKSTGRGDAAASESPSKDAPKSIRDADFNPTTPWLRELASYVDYSGFRKVWLNPLTEQAEQGFLAACYEKLAQRANSEGEYFLAHDAANHGLRCAATAEFPPHELTAKKVTALARSGAVEEAQRVLEDFLKSYEPNSAICSAQSRLYRDRGLAAADREERRELMRMGAKWAAKAKECATKEGEDWAYPANQEVQFHFLAGNVKVAQALAAGVIRYVEALPDTDSMWNRMNLADMRLILGELEAAGIHYREAAERGANSPGDVAANRTVAHILMAELEQHQPVDGGLKESWFPQPVLAVFAGHIPDVKDRKPVRLPESICRRDGDVALEIKKRLEGMNAVEGICASAPGGDILFAEAIVGRKARLALVDPFPRTRIEKVATLAEYDWSDRLKEVFKSAGRTDPITCAEDADEAAQCQYATQVMLGAAMLRARRINAQLRALVLWDESDAESPQRGGTGEFVILCRAQGVPVEIINPKVLL